VRKQHLPSLILGLLLGCGDAKEPVQSQPPPRTPVEDMSTQARKQRAEERYYEEQKWIAKEESYTRLPINDPALQDRHAEHFRKRMNDARQQYEDEIRKIDKESR
jgi:hypothetical protein